MEIDEKLSELDRKLEGIKEKLGQKEKATPIQIWTLAIAVLGPAAVALINFYLTTDATQKAAIADINKTALHALLDKNGDPKSAIVMIGYLNSVETACQYATALPVNGVTDGLRALADLRPQEKGRIQLALEAVRKRQPKAATFGGNE